MQCHAYSEKEGKNGEELAVKKILHNEKRSSLEPTRLLGFPFPAVEKAYVHNQNVYHKNPEDGKASEHIQFVYSTAFENGSEGVVCQGD